LPRELIESELFGSSRGAFTGSQGDRDGLFRQAEAARCCSMSFPKCPSTRKANCCASFRKRKSAPSAAGQLQTDCRINRLHNRLVEDALKEGKLRETSFIGSVHFHCAPAAAERREDILAPGQRVPSAVCFAGRPYARRLHALAAERWQHDWPGNVRQLHK